MNSSSEQANGLSALAVEGPMPSRKTLLLFGALTILLMLIFWVALSPTLSGRRVDSDLRFMMERRLAAADIAIPFPQHDVRLDVRSPLPVRVVPTPDPGA